MPDNAHLQRTVMDALNGDVCLTIDDLLSKTDLSRKQISEAAIGLINRGYLERVERGCFQMTKGGRLAKQQGTPLTSGPNGKTGRKKPLRNTFRCKLWRAMRLKRKFTIGDIVALAASGDEQNPENNARHYLQGLCQFGYVLKLPRREPGTAITSNGYKRYSLVRNTGDQAPVIRNSTSTLFDPNTGEEVSCQR